MKDNRAELSVEEVIKLILGAAVVLILVLLIYNLIAPNFDKDKETVKSYFNSLKKAVVEADEGVGEFEIWQSNVALTVVYFGESVLVGIGVDAAFHSVRGKNRLCLCHTKKEDSKERSFCDYCVNLKYPARKDLGSGKISAVGVQWVITGDKMKVEILNDAGGDFYLFIEVEDD